MPTITDPRGRHISLSRSGEIAILDMDGRELSTHRVPYGAHLLCESGHIVSRGDRIAEWDPSFSPVITEKAGTREVPGPDREPDDDRADRRVDRHRPARRHRRHRQVEEGGPASAPDHDRRGRQGGRRLPPGPGAIIAVEDGQTVEAGEVLARMPREAARTRDITGGLPRVAELFEARKPKENAIIAKVSGKVSFKKDYKAKRKIAIIPDDGSARGRISRAQVEGDRGPGRRLRQARRQPRRRLAGPARHPRGARRRGAGRISRFARSRRSIDSRA